MARITMSKLPRLAQCPASAALPGVDAANPWSSAGTITHRFLERVAQVGAEVALAEAPEDHRARLACIELDGLPITKEHRQEVTYAYDVATGTARKLGEGLGRDYGRASETEIVGTADVDGPGVICDYKTDHGHDELAPPPRENLQLRALALAKARAEGLDEVTVEIIRIRDDGQSRFEPAKLDFFDLEDTAAELRRIVDRVADAEAKVSRGEVPDVRESVHCRYCPASLSCPAKTALLRQAAAAPQTVAAEMFSLLTPEMAAKAYEVKKQIGRLYGDLKQALEAYAEQHPIDLGGGLVFGKVERPSDTLNGKIAYAVLSERYDPEVAAAAVSIECTKTGLEEALRTVKARTGVPLAQLKREAMQALGAAGGVTTEIKAKFDTYKKEQS